MSVSKYERGINVPSERTLAELARILGVSAAWLRYGEGDSGSAPLSTAEEERDLAWAAEAAGLCERCVDALRDVRRAIGPMPRSELLSIAERLRTNDPEKH